MKSPQQAKPAGPRHWSAEEDALLREAVKQHGPGNWRTVATFVPSRSRTQCLQRWNKVLKPGLLKGPWSREEDHLLRCLVDQSLQCLSTNPNKAAVADDDDDDGADEETPVSKRIDWVLIAENIPGRTIKQCRERWCCNLDPSVKKGEWTKAEDELILRIQAERGNCWAYIAREMPGRTEHRVKTRFRSLMRARRHVWSPAEDELLIKSYQELGPSWSKICDRFNGQRAKFSITSRVKQLQALGRLPSSAGDSPATQATPSALSSACPTPATVADCDSSLDASIEPAAPTKLAAVDPLAEVDSTPLVQPAVNAAAVPAPVKAEFSRGAMDDLFSIASMPTPGASIGSPAPPETDAAGASHNGVANWPSLLQPAQIGNTSAALLDDSISHVNPPRMSSHDRLPSLGGFAQTPGEDVMTGHESLLHLPMPQFPSPSAPGGGPTASLDSMLKLGVAPALIPSVVATNSVLASARTGNFLKRYSDSWGGGNDPLGWPLLSRFDIETTDGAPPKKRRLVSRQSSSNLSTASSRLRRHGSSQAQAIFNALSC